MPLPRYQPVKKKAKVVAGPSLDDLDDACLSRVIAHALDSAKTRADEPYVGDNGRTERNFSLVSRRWYFLTQTQVSDHGVHKIDLEQALKRATSSIKPNVNRFNPGGNLSSTAAKTPRRIGLHASAALTSSKTPGAASARKRLPYGVLSQRNLTATTTNANPAAATRTSGGSDSPQASRYDIKLFRAIHPKLLKYKHVQLSGSITVDNFDKLLVALNSARIERLDLLKLRVENARSYALSEVQATSNLYHLQALTYTWTNNPKEDASNALLWTIYERAVNLRELQVYLTDEVNHTSATATNTTTATSNRDDLAQPASAGLAQSAICNFNGKLGAPLMARHHPHLVKIIFDRMLPPNVEPNQHVPASNCEYSILIRRVLSQESSVLSLDTNDCSLVEYLILASNRLCTKHELRLLKLTHPIKSFELLQRLVKLPNLGTRYLSIVIDNIEQIGEVRTVLENFSFLRKNQARCQLNLYLQDQKFPDNEEKVKNLINLCRLVDVNVYISALQRISIDCCHLMWSTGRALQAVTSEPQGRCIFKISLQTYPIKPNTVNPCEITVPFGRCSQYKINRVREDVVRHREIMKALKRDCYHQFVKSVRDNNGS